MFERDLSFAIDAIHAELNDLIGKTGLWVKLRRWFLYRELRRLEGMIPSD
jgi:hypothetical protein